MSTKSAWMRWGMCSLVVLAMIAVLGGCSKKKAETAATETMTSPMVGTYAADMAAGKVSLMLNADNTAMMSMQAMDNTPAAVKNGTWAAGASANLVDVTFTGEGADSAMSMTLNFAASGDTLSLTNGDAAGLGPVSLMKQH